MIKIENTEVMGWEAAIRGMRNPMNSWEMSDSAFTDSWISVNDRMPEKQFYDWVLVKTEFNEGGYGVPHVAEYISGKWQFSCLDSIDAEKTLALKVTHWMPIEKRENSIGPNDLSLMRKLAVAGPVHAKYRRMITVYCDITAPLYWWKEFDTYKVGTVANSCSTMHKIADKRFEREDFSIEHLENCAYPKEGSNLNGETHWMVTMDNIISSMNVARELYLSTNDKKYWWQMIQLLPSSYNQKRTVMLNYEVLSHIYHDRKNHKLDEWCKHSCTTTESKEWGNKVYLGFCDWVETLPYSELITGEEEME